MIYDSVAIVCSDGIKAVVLGAQLRRANIVTETYFSGSVKKQWAKAKEYEVVVLADEQPMVVIDRFYGGRMEVKTTLLDAVLMAFEGLDPEPLA